MVHRELCSDRLDGKAFVLSAAAEVREFRAFQAISVSIIDL